MRIRKNVSLTHGPATFYGSESRRLHMSAVHLFQDRPTRSARRSAPPSSLRYTHKHGAHRAAVATCRRYGNVAGTCRCCRSLESWQRRRQDDDGRRARPCTASGGVFFGEEKPATEQEGCQCTGTVASWGFSAPGRRSC